MAAAVTRGFHSVLRDMSGCDTRAHKHSLLQVCDAMLHLAEHGVRHRDVALRNVLAFSFDPLLRHAVRVKVCDYGLAAQGRCAIGGLGKRVCMGVERTARGIVAILGQTQMAVSSRPAPRRAVQ